MTLPFGRRFGAALLTLVAAGGLAACGSSSSKSTTSTPATSTPAAKSGPGVGKPAITIGDKNFPEEFLLGDLYAQALQAKGFTVNLKPNIGSSEITDKALTSGQIDAYPEYTGTILSVLAAQTKNPTSATQAYSEAKAFEAKRGFTLVGRTPFFDSDAVATLKSYATKNNLVSVADLKKLGSSLKLAALPEFRTRFAGLVGLKQVYGVSPTFVPLGTNSLPYAALDAGQVQAADVFTTDGQLQSGKYTLLKDPKFIFGFQNVTLVISKSKLAAEGSAFTQIIDNVSKKLTNKAVVAMNAAIQLDKKDPATVAHQFLAANGLA
jgi:osmoprotectant transport system substrate-binding protein